jgi:AcrR family transcriptional regulator
VSATDVVPPGADWHRRVVNRSLRTATRRSIDRGSNLVIAAAKLLEKSDDGDFTVQDVANEANQSLRTLYQYFESKDDLLLAVFEEAMRSYAEMIGDAIIKLDDPLDRLAGALLAAITIPEHSERGINSRLARLRLKLAQVDPDQVGRAQLPINSLVRNLLDVAATAGRVDVTDLDAATYLLLTLNASSITSRMLGNDTGNGQPALVDVVSFSLRGIGALLEPGYVDALQPRLRLPRGPIRISNLSKEAP